MLSSLSDVFSLRSLESSDLSEHRSHFLDLYILIKYFQILLISYFFIIKLFYIVSGKWLILEEIWHRPYSFHRKYLQQGRYDHIEFFNSIKGWKFGFEKTPSQIIIKANFLKTSRTFFLSPFVFPTTHLKDINSS